MEGIDACDGTTVCVPCAGTPVASCTLAPVMQACNDNDPCTENDMEGIDACDGTTVCVPCAGTPVAACTQTTSVACDDNDSCTINDVEIIDSCSGAVCVPCAGTFDQPSCCGDVNLDINFDNLPAQTSWDITDTNGNVVASGGTYGGQAGGSNLNLPQVACLPDGCYDLTFYDSANDGMCPRRTASVLTGINISVLGFGNIFSPRIALMCGDYTLTDANGTVLASGGGRFGTSETSNFCISGGVAQLNYQPDNVYSMQSAMNEDGLSLKLVPTLTSNDLTVYTSFDEDVNPQIHVVNINGQLMEQFSQEVTTTELRLDVSNLPSGIYFVQMVANDTVLVEKFVKR